MKWIVYCSVKIAVLKKTEKKVKKKKNHSEICNAGFPSAFVVFWATIARHETSI